MAKYSRKEILISLDAARVNVKIIVDFFVEKLLPGRMVGQQHRLPPYSLMVTLARPHLSQI